MPTKTASTPAPLTFDLDQALVEKIEYTRETLGLASTSEVVRLAISEFDYNRYKPDVQPHRQISVRLTSDLRAMLKKQSRMKNTSIGELLRVAIEALADSGLQKETKKKEKKDKKKKK